MIIGQRAFRRNKRRPNVRRPDKNQRLKRDFSALALLLRLIAYWMGMYDKINARTNFIISIVKTVVVELGLGYYMQFLINLPK